MTPVAACAYKAVAIIARNLNSRFRWRERAMQTFSNRGVWKRRCGGYRFMTCARFTSRRHSDRRGGRRTKARFSFCATSSGSSRRQRLAMRNGGKSSLEKC